MISIETIFLGAAIHGLALVLLLTFNSYANRKANLLLALLVGLLTVAMWNVYAHRSDERFAAPLVDYYLWATPLLWAPVLFLYVGQLTKQKEVSGPRFLLHALPAIFVAILQIPLHLFRESEAGAALLQLAYNVIVTLIYPQIAVYFFLSLRLLKSYRSAAEETHSAIERINLNWLKTVLFLFSLVLAADMSVNVPAALLGTEMPAYYDAILLAEACAVFAIGYLSLRQPEILLGISLDPPAPSSPASAKYLDSPVDEKLGAELADKLDRLMDRRQIYLQNDLKLQELADAMGLSPHHLSQVINQQRHKNFYDFVNGYRARFAADYLIKHGKTNLTRLAFDAGFNNRVSFSNAFKKHSGVTPSEFIKKHEAAKRNRVLVDERPS